VVEEIAQFLRKDGIYVSVHPSGKNRANLLARLQPLSPAADRPLMLQASLDVAPCAARRWSTPPLQLTAKEGTLRGCGVVQNKAFVAAAITAFVELKRRTVPLRREVWLVLTSHGQQRGSGGLTHLLEVLPELSGAAGAIIPGGWVARETNGITAGALVQIANKVHVPVRLVAYGDTGWAGRPPEEAAADRLLGALARVRKDAFPDSGVAAPPFVVGPVRRSLRSTCQLGAVEALRGEDLPMTASARLECFLAQGDQPQQIMWRLVDVIADPRVVVERVGKGHAGRASPTDHPVLNSIKNALAERGGLTVTTACLAGNDDGDVLRAAGVPTYGFTPFPLSVEELMSTRGDDERMTEEAFTQGVMWMERIVTPLVTATP
jgi:acetylornithine deacetylase/succinyl-diaminopimelate desuccinylase-like protein